MIISTLCIFSGGLPETDSDAAAKALRAAGYEIYRLPLELKAKLEVEGDDFIEVRRRARADAFPETIMAHVERIVSPFGGYVDGSCEAAMEPFADLTSA
jgi:hypothetical protein